MINKLTNHTIALISAAYKDNIYDDSWGAVYKYACISCSNCSKCPYAPFRFYDSRVCIRRKSYDPVNRMNLYCNIDDPAHREKFISFLNGQSFDLYLKRIS